MINFDTPQYSAEKIEPRFGMMRNPDRSMVDMSSPETRGVFQQNAAKDSSALSPSGELSFNTSDIYGGASASASATAPTDTANIASAATQATVSDSSLTTPNLSPGAQVADLTPQQSDINQSVVKIETPTLTVGADGQLSLSKDVSTGFLFDGADGQQHVAATDHGESASGQPSIYSGDNSYALGKSTITFADGTQTTASVSRNNTFATNDDGVTAPDRPDVAILDLDYKGPLLQHPSLPLGDNTALNPGDTLNSVGYGNDQLQGHTSQYLGITTPADAAPNTTDNTPVMLMSGDSIHGMSGSPVVNADGAVVGITAAGTQNSSDGQGFALDTPISNLKTLSNSLGFDQNYLYNIANGKEQPIASEDDHGNSSDQSFTGYTLSDGTHIDAPSSSSSSTESPDTAPTTTQPTDSDSSSTEEPTSPTDNSVANNSTTASNSFNVPFMGTMISDTPDFGSSGNAFSSDSAAAGVGAGGGGGGLGGDGGVGGGGGSTDDGGGGFSADVQAE